jgi:UDP-N-acetylmuramyl pentapeptide phosphotransferase/UDP-N-acetylglucosamine-1-phosphate transferase
VIGGGSTWVAVVVAAVATHGLAELALERGWIDRREGAEDRKPRRSPVPLVGGGALLAALLVWDLAGGRGLPWPALLAAGALGFVDDRRVGGLPVRPKVLGQLGVALLLALFPAGAGVEGLLDRLALAVVAVVAMNAVNTFDNADGAASVLGLAALWPVAGARGALLGYLPFNLFLRRRGLQGERPPRAMLGDSGSHVLGVLIATTPGAEPFLLVPLLDLARLAVVRERVGRRPWEGDRRHLAHRFEALGLGPVAVAGCLAGILAPTWLAARIGSGAEMVPLGVMLSTAFYFLALSATPDPDAHLGLEGLVPPRGPSGGAPGPTGETRRVDPAGGDAADFSDSQTPRHDDALAADRPTQDHGPP